MRRIFKSKLSTKITIFIFIFIVLPTVMITVYLTKVYQKLIKEDIERATQQQVETIEDNIGNNFNIVFQKMNSFGNRPAVTRLMNENYSRSGTIQEIKISLPELCVDTGAINLYLYINSLNSYYAAFGSIIPDEVKRAVEGMKEDQSINSNDFKIVMDTETHTIFCIKVIRDYRTMIFRGLIIARLPSSELTKYIEKIHNTYGDIYVVTEGGSIVYAPLKRELTYQIEDIELKNESMQLLGEDSVYVKSLKNSDLYVVGINKRFTASRLRLHFQRIFMLIIVSVAFSLVLSLVLIKLILNPLNELTEYIRNTDPDNLRTISKKYQDEETQVLANAYNELVTKVNENIDKKYKAELALKQAQINSLQYQINPHFVNNTLQLIGAMAADRDMFDLYEIVLAFSRIFYYSIKFKGGSYVTLEDELEFLDNYITLQQARYLDNLKFEKVIQQECQDIVVPKIIIQPLIENCFSHAFVKKDGEWWIKVGARIRNRILTISVSDNGTGMGADQIKRLDAELADPDKTLKTGTSHIGIRNVNARLCLLYGIAYRLRFTSKEEEGTTFYIQIPIDSEVPGQEEE